MYKLLSSGVVVVSFIDTGFYISTFAICLFNVSCDLTKWWTTVVIT